MNLPPVHPGSYTDEERAVIASYLLQQRAGTLAALSSVSTPPKGSTNGWAEGNVRYYKSAEAYSRFLLYWVGYTVPKDGMYTP